MTSYKLSNTAKEDIIRIHQYGVSKFGIKQADLYFHQLFEYFEIIGKNPFSFEAVDYIRKDYRRCVCGSDSIFYSVNNDMVEIITIIWKQDLDSIFS